MKDGVITGTGNSRYLKSVSNFLTLYPTYADFVAALVAGTLPIDLNGINAAGWTQEGTALNKANLLTDTTKTKLGLPSSDPTVNEALAGIETTYTATLSAANWTGTSAPYTQTVTVTGMLASDNPTTDIVQSATQATAETELEDWGYVSKITTAANQITATCYTDKPTINLNIQLKVVR